MDLLIKRIEHFSINVSDIKKASAFYSGVLGFKPLETVPAGDKDLVYFDIDGTARLELFDFHGKAVRSAAVENGCDPLGYVHVAFLVDNVDEWAAHLRKNSVDIVLEPCDLTNLGMRVCLFNDPDGNTLEICVPLS